LDESVPDPVAAVAREAEAVSTDAELVAAVTRGDAGATSRLYRRLVPVIDRTLLRVLGGRDRDHEDLVQLSLEHLLRSILHQKFRLDCSLQHWAAALSSRLAISELRRRTRTPSVLTEPDALERQRDERLRAWENASRATESRDLVRRALARIAVERAEVLYLYEVEGFQLAEIAKLTGVSVASAQSRLVRGRKQLAELIGKLGHRSHGEDDHDP
jgi:RNA polymerase sigma-70 factor (ECF subfamily)